MKLKEIDRTGNVAWSPAGHHPILLAVGTAAQQLDATFSTNALLELYTLSLNESSQEMEVAGSLTTDSRFYKLVWGSAGQLIGGAEQGQIFIWDPEKILRNEGALVHNLKKHTGPVSALDMNPFQTNLLASGAGDSEIYVWDLSNPDKPMAPGAKAQPVHDVSCVAWNRQVQHILGSSHGGSCVVWDLRKNEPIIKIRDSMSRIKCNTMCWHPDIATQLCISSEDDHTPVIQLWDLRSASSPLKVLENHERGILSMAWCPSDADLLLSCGKDNRILCWNPNSEDRSGEIVYELYTGSQWSFDVQWCLRNPAVISACSFDGHISVYSLMGGGVPTQTSSKVEDAFPKDQFSPSFTHQAPVNLDGTGLACEPMLKKPPKWLRRPVGCSFAFGGKLVSFDNFKPPSTGPTHQQAPLSTVTVSQVITTNDLVQRSKALEETLQRGTFSEFCDVKIANAGKGDDASVWQFLKVNFEDNPRLKYLELLGYSHQDAGRYVTEALGASKMSSRDSSRSDLKRLTPQPPFSDDESGVNGATNGLASLDAFGKGDGAFESSAFDAIATTEREAVEFDDSPLHININTDYEGLVSRALLTANFEAAVEACLHFGHTAEAIILANAGGPELLSKTQKQVLCANGGSSINKLISAVVTRDLESVVRSCDIENWKEAVTTILTYADGDEFTNLCNLLGSRLESSGNKSLYSNALLCYIVAGNLDRLVTLWCSQLPKGQTSQEALQNLVEKFMVLRRAVESFQGPGVSEVGGNLMNDRLTEYAELLVAQGCALTAYNYLSSSSTNHMPIAILKDRLYHSTVSSSLATAAPPRPFKVIDIQPDLRQLQELRQQQLQQQLQPAQPFPQQVQQLQQRSRQRTNSANYNQQGTSQSFYPAPQSSYTQQNAVHPSTGYATSQYQQPTVQPAMTHHHQPAVEPVAPFVPEPVAAAPGTRSRGLSGKYPTHVGHPQPVQTVPGYQPQPIQPVPGYQPHSVQPTPSYQPQPQRTNYPAMYDPAAEMSSTYTPGAPYTSSTTAAPKMEAWNDPPPITGESRKTRADHAPGGPVYDGLIYNPQDYQTQHHAQPPQWTQGQPQQPQPYSDGIGRLDAGLVQGGNYAPVEQAKKVVQPIPDEHLVLQQVLDGLANICINRTTNQQIKKKLEDVQRKLELLYERLRTNTLSHSTTTSLHQIIQCIQQYDYASSLAYHAELVRVGSFSEISAFMPAIKSLVQTAQQLQAYIQ